MVRACPHMECGCPVYFSTRDNLPGHLAICVNNIIIMCIGLVHDIFRRNNIRHADGQRF